VHAYILARASGKAAQAHACEAHPKALASGASVSRGRSLL